MMFEPKMQILNCKLIEPLSMQKTASGVGGKNKTVQTF